MANPHQRSGWIMIALAWVGIFIGIYWFTYHAEQRQINPNSAKILINQGKELTLLANRSGHYLAEGLINEKPVTFLLDTGATSVSLSSELAQSLGLQVEYKTRLQTANGEVIGYATHLKRVQIGEISVDNVGAVISPGIEGDTVLLGMSFLKRVEFTQRDGRLVLKK